jgi:hypothetical protein
MPWQEEEKLTQVGGPLPAHHIHTTMVRGLASASCAGTPFLNPHARHLAPDGKTERSSLSLSLSLMATGNKAGVDAHLNWEDPHRRELVLTAMADAINTQLPRGQSKVVARDLDRMTRQLLQHELEGAAV